MIGFSCPYCSSVMKFDDAFAGKAVKCLKCQREMMAPELSVAAAPAPADSAPAPAAGPAAAPVAAAAPAASPDSDVLQRETVQSFVHKLLIVIVLVAAQWLVDYLPGGTSFSPLGLSLTAWIHLFCGAGIVILMFLILSPLRRLVPYYIGLTFRVQPRLAAEPELRSQVSKAATYFIMAAYVAAFYWAVVPSLNLVPRALQITQLAIAVVCIVFVVMFVLAIRPLLARASSKITDKAMEATQRLDSKPCAGCNARVPLTAKFCPSCGKPA